jgi:hypothetical protein
MARFYARFDSGSNGTTWVSGLDSTAATTGYFDRRRIGANSASGALIRDGLIASRSALSTDAKQDIPFTYQNGQIGGFVPADNQSTNGSTFVSFSRAGGSIYSASTSAPPGIITPASNTYGGGSPINYSLRPTASVFSTDTRLGGPTASVGVAYSTYTAANSAVSAALAAIGDGGTGAAGTLNSPYTRRGQIPSRTFHSIWHDPDVQYFGWDDFTPGSMSTSGMDLLFAVSDCNQTSPNPGATSTIRFQWSNTLSYQFRNDGNSSGRIGIEIEVSKAAGATGTCDANWGVARFRLQLGYSATTHGGPLTLGTSTSSNGPTNPSTLTSPGNCTGTSTWSWNGFGGYGAGGTPELLWTVKLEDCLSPGYDVNVSVTLFDATITTNSTQQAGVYTEQVAIPNTA